MTAVRRYAAFLRGVSPMNAKMTELRASFEAAGFSNVKTVLGSGNVVFDARGRVAEPALAERAERAMDRRLGRTFATIVRSIDDLAALVDEDPFAAFRLARGAKRVVTFLRDAPGAAPAKPAPKAPLVLGDARILAVRPREVLTAYVPTPGSPVFMSLIERTFGKDVTTRTWETVTKVAAV